MGKNGLFLPFFDPKNFFKKLKIRPLDDFFEGLEVREHPIIDPKEPEKTP